MPVKIVLKVTLSLLLGSELPSAHRRGLNTVVDRARYKLESGAPNAKALNEFDFTWL